MSWTDPLTMEEIPIPDLSIPTINPIKFISSISNEITGTGLPNATVDFFINGELDDNLDVDDAGIWSHKFHDNGLNNVLYLTVQQKFTFEPPDDGTVGDSVAKTSELSAPMEVQILKKPSFEQPKIDSFMVESAEFNAEGQGTPDCTVTLQKQNANAWGPIENATAEVDSTGTWKIVIPPGSDGSFDPGPIEIRAVQQYCSETENVQSEPSETITFTVETSNENMTRMQASHSKGEDARNAAYLKKYQALQTKFGDTGITCDIGIMFFTKLMSREKSDSGVKPDLNDIFKTLRITETTRKTTGVTHQDWMDIIKSIKTEKRFITHTYHGFQAMDQDGSGEVTLDEAAELMVAQPSDEDDKKNEITLEEAKAKVKLHAATFDTDGSGILDFPEFFKMILSDRENQRQKKFKLENDTKVDVSEDGGDGDGGGGGGKGNTKSGTNKRNTRALFKKAFRKITIAQGVWGTPCRAIEDRERRAKETAEAIRLEAERLEKEEKEKKKIEADKKARKKVYNDKIAADQARRVQGLEDERMARLEANRRKITAAKGLAPSAPQTPDTVSPDNKGSLFRRRKKPMSSLDLGNFLLNASMEVFGGDDPKTAIIPAAITVTGHPNKIPKKDKTEPEVASRIGQWTF